MSIQFGRWHYEGARSTPEYVNRIRTLIGAYGPDGNGVHAAGGLTILYSALHATNASRSECQPYVMQCGAIVTWDGRLDNREELISTVGNQVGLDCPDVSLVAAAYDTWGLECFARLRGDWALSIWDPKDRSLFLAKDPIGVRPLFYSADRDAVSWSSLLEPLVQDAGRAFALNEEYIAGYFSLFPATHVTPYQGIASVPASSYVRIRPGNQTTRKYWDFDPDKRIRYRSDAEYQDHFRDAFEASVRRRLRSSGPVLAELSGGVDSSSIVCVADAIIADRVSGTEQELDTLSYFHDLEPNWNERPYVQEIEKRRGRAGYHIDLADDRPFAYEMEGASFQTAPGSRPNIGPSARRRTACLRAGGYRVVLSGIGGDEVTGGVPTPLPELADLVAVGRFRRLAHQLKAWALVKRKPWFYLFFETVGRFFPPSIGGLAPDQRPPSWLAPAFVGRQRRALCGYQDRTRLFGPLPSFQEALSTLDALRRQIACDEISSDPPYETRYPFLDRDLLEFLYAIPREQLVRPGERRSLMRRALTGIVPEKVLFRRRKAYISRAPLVAISQQQDGFADLTRNMVTASLGIVDAKSFIDALAKVREGKEARIVSIFRTLDLEFWLRNQRSHIGSQPPCTSSARPAT